MIEVRLAPLLHRYTGGLSTVHASGATLHELLDDLDGRFPGIRFRIVDEQDRPRRHVRFFVNETDARDVGTSLKDGDEVYIVGALSGG
ncbi:MAG TPA: MoaD/ThiS family protein [Acetobacteraceae bacterium]|nr:MoaD/ThiS family protein [Acetobacteraceae bacterium]